MAQYQVQDPQGQMHIIEGPDGATPDQVLAQAQALVPAQAQPPAAPQSSTMQKIGNAVSTVAKSPLDVLAAPFQAVGEAIRMPIEGDSNFRPPTILQKLGVENHIPDFMKGHVDTTGKPPADPFNLANRLVRAGAAGVATGNPTTARAEYDRPANLVDTGSDMATALMAGKMAPEVANAPLDAIVNAPGEIADTAKGAAGWVGKKLIRATLGPTEEAQAARFANPAAVKGALLEGQVGDKAAETANALSQKISDADNAAWKTLRTDYLPPEEGGTAVPKTDVLNVLNDAKKELSVHGGGVVGRAAKAASSALDEITSDIQGIGKYVGGYIKSQQGADSSIRLNNFLPEATRRGIIQSLDQNINWDNPDMGPINAALEKARVAIDMPLKAANDAYAKQMEKVAQMTGDLQTFRQKIGLVKDAGEPIMAGDTTPGKITAIGRRDMPETDRMLAGVKDATGHDIQKEADLARLKREFIPDTDRARGSTRTVLGGAVGSGIGLVTGHPTLGAAVGAGVGRLADINGGQMAGNIIDALSAGNSRIAELLQAIRARGDSSSMSPAITALLRQSYMAPSMSQAQDQYSRRGGR